MTVVERHKLILDALQKEEVLTVDEISKMTGMSLPTVRRDLNSLAEQKLVVRFHGGVTLAGEPAEDNLFSLDLRIDEEKEIKKEIAKKAASLVNDGDIIFLDSGSTTYYMCEFLKDKKVMVVTNGIYNIIKLVENGIETYVLPGQVRRGVNNTLGKETVDKLHELSVDKAFLGVRGVDIQRGYTTTDTFDNMLKTMAIKSAGKSYVLADSSKLFQKKFYSFGKLNEAALITTKCDRSIMECTEVILAD